MRGRAGRASAVLLVVVAACSRGSGPGSGGSGIGIGDSNDTWGGVEDDGPGADTWTPVDDDRGSDSAGSDDALDGSGGEDGIGTGTSQPGADTDTGDSTGAAGSTTTGPQPNPFAGDWSGNAHGTCQLLGDIDGTWDATVADNGDFTCTLHINGGSSYSVDGTVSDSGQVDAGGNCDFDGALGGGGGSFDCNAVPCSGTWTVN